MAFESFLHQNLQREDLSFRFRYVHDSSQVDPHGFASIFNVCIYITFSLSLDHVISKCVNDAFFIVHLVRGKIFLFGTNMYCCSWISKPGFGSVCGTIDPYYQSVCDWVDGDGGSCIVPPSESFRIMSPLTTTFAQHFTLMCPVQLQFLHFRWVLVWNTTFKFLLMEVSPCLWLHSVLRCEITTFGSRIPLKVPMMGSHEGIGIDRVITPVNCASVMSTPRPPQASLSLCSSAMWVGSFLPHPQSALCKVVFGLSSVQ